MEEGGGGGGESAQRDFLCSHAFRTHCGQTFTVRRLPALRMRSRRNALWRRAADSRRQVAGECRPEDSSGAANNKLSGGGGGGKSLRAPSIAAAGRLDETRARALLSSRLEGRLRFAAISGRKRAAGMRRKRRRREKKGEHSSCARPLVLFVPTTRVMQLNWWR